MGVQNKQRRAAKKKKAQGRPRPRPDQRFVPEVTPELARHRLVQALAEISTEGETAEWHAHALLRPDAFVPPDLSRQALCELLDELVTSVVAHGWLPSDLVHVVSRQRGQASVAAVIALLTRRLEQHPSSRIAPAWREDLLGCGLGVLPDLRDVRGLQAALQLAACIATLPPLAVLLPPPGAVGAGAASHAGGDPKLLAKVRALLAKAESTEFDEEAEALSAKAQELISRHALDRLLTETAGGAAEQKPAARRLWIDPPYVTAKSLLVAAVADANRCRSVLDEGLGCCTVVGQPSDLDAVDVLMTSLMLQASTAMRRYGRQTDRAGTSRTRSFRQSFLVAYAGRIRERLLDAADEAVQTSGRSGELVPVLHRRAEQVEAATAELFPHLVTRTTAIRNAQGWAAGRAAADLARLDTDLQLDEAAG